MGKIKDLPLLERPREKALRYGITTLSDIELLAVIIGSGTSGHSALEIATAIVIDKKGLVNAFNCLYQDFLDYPGLSQTASIKLSAAFELGKRYQMLNLENNHHLTAEHYIFEKYIPLVRSSSLEMVIVLILNRRKRILFEKTISIGSETSVNCSVKEILKLLIVNKGQCFYILHNHPNDYVEPSDDDISFTTQIIKEAKKIGIKLIDHLIINEESIYSFKEGKCLPFS